MTEPCIQEEEIGKIKEFIDSMKGFKATLFTIATAIIVQVATFLFLWGGLTTTVNKNTDYIWNDLTHITAENTRNIDKILAKLEFVVNGRKYKER